MFQNVRAKLRAYFRNFFCAKRSARLVNNRLLELHDRVLAGPPWRPLGAWLERTHVTSGPAELRGEHRFVADGMLTSRDCRRLIDILQAAGVAGDGYRQRVPHTPFEEFRGLSFGRLVVKVARDEASRNSLRFLMDVADAARLFVARQFGVVELHSSYTHLVGRTYLPGLGQKRPASDLSHPIHVDNCLLFDNGTCSRGKGAYIHRHYSAILYLNDNFKGGEFVFARDLIDRKPVVRVRAHCGRLVGFSAGTENPHGVLAVTAGTRYALAMWYTETAAQREDEKMVAELYLHDPSMAAVKNMVSGLDAKFKKVDKMLGH
ncbi:prolyl 3-hydroxylase 3-like [Pollicipes pollicipes]|uniref:prolyl 3-hydroxylase 3-like n=1 Tax=Pollicipes pollicipes TaxID=41117 RepID=UPI001885534D|nr:prolyl 3-hydroxylase 3-like [Pollicipes pollicipes]